jgi:hypothetical protein
MQNMRITLNPGEIRAEKRERARGTSSSRPLPFVLELLELLFGAPRFRHD